MELGITKIIVHELIEHGDEEGEILGTAVVMNTLSAVLCVMGVFAFSAIANYGEVETTVVCVLYSLLLIFKAIEVLTYWFQAQLLSKYSSMVSLIAYVIVSAYKIFLLATRKGVYWFALSYAIDHFVISLLLFVLFKRLCKTRLTASKERAKSFFSQGRYYIVSSMMVTIFAQTDRIMLKSMVGNEAVGFYSAAVTCAGFTSFVVTAIIDSFRPVIFERKKESEEQFERNLVRLYSMIIYFSLAQSVVMTLGSRVIVNVVYGPRYGPSINALKIVVWYTTFSYLGSVRNIWLLAENKQKYLWMINLSGAAANVILNFLLIPGLGIYGAAIASLVTQFFTNFVIGYLVRPISHNNDLIMRGLNLNNLKEIVKIIIK